MEKIDIKVVIGLNYGDEGKGLVTDYLSNLTTSSCAVVRFNGGAQAGHTVETPNGNRHIFHHIGAGAFCGASTILSKFFVVNPILFFNEAKSLCQIIGHSKMKPVYVDWECEITTPYDVFINQVTENARGNKRHGSCGVGFGETIERASRGYSLKVGDIDCATFKDKVEKIRNEWFPNRLKELGISETHSLDQEVFDVFISNTQLFIRAVLPCDSIKAMKTFKSLIFEGAQGLRLDQSSEDFPNVTRSNTGLQNVADLISNLYCKVTVYYVTRAYMTRHGAGPLDNQIDLPKKFNDKTNVFNDFQGNIRCALLDLPYMSKIVQKDKRFLQQTAFLTVGVVTCCDQIEEKEVKSIQEGVCNAVGANQMLLSFGPTRNDIKLVEVSTNVLC